MTTIIIDYGSGNLRSAEKSFQRMAADPSRIRVSSDPEDIATADRLVLPGVGAFADCRAGVAAIEEALFCAVQTRAVPFLGICVGMQLLATTGREHGMDCAGFDWIGGIVDAITPDDPALKVPHMGWNALEITGEHPVFAGITSGDHAYFVHSYHLAAADPATVVATTDHGGKITAAVGRDNIIGTQFHPEKSQATGLRLIENFLTWAP